MTGYLIIYLIPVVLSYIAIAVRYAIEHRRPPELDIFQVHGVSPRLNWTSDFRADSYIQGYHGSERFMVHHNFMPGMACTHGLSSMGRSIKGEQ